jgi:hypothetical protein
MMEAVGFNLALYVAVVMDAEVNVFVIALNISGSDVRVEMQRALHFGRVAQAQLQALSLAVFPLINASKHSPICVVLA